MVQPLAQAGKQGIDLVLIMPTPAAAGAIWLPRGPIGIDDPAATNERGSRNDTGIPA